MAQSVRRLSLLLLLLVPAFAAFAQQRLVDPDSPDSARGAALRMLRHLADGELEAAARLSNAPERRLEVLRDYLKSVGEENFRRTFGRYFAPENPVVAEVAIGPRRLIVWDLGEAGNRLAGQFYIQVDGRFLMDDVPSSGRAQLRRILDDYRAGHVKY